MERAIPAVALVVVTGLTAPHIEAQEALTGVPGDFKAVEESVIRIRTVAELETTRSDTRTGEERPGTRPYSIDGSGVVVGEIEIDGRREYLILTNHHVADASNYVLEEGGYLRVNPENTLAVPSVEEKSFLMRAPTQTISDEDVLLIELVRHVRGDMTLMRTVGVDRELTVFDGRIGYAAGEIAEGAAVVTSGFPWGAERLVAMGSIVEVYHAHDLGMPHRDFVVDLPVEPGQSGGPLFLMEEDEAGAVEFRLIGLIHARDRERNYAVPYSLWEDALGDFPETLQERLVR